MEQCTRGCYLGPSELLRKGVVEDGIHKTYCLNLAGVNDLSFSLSPSPLPPSPLLPFLPPPSFPVHLSYLNANGHSGEAEGRKKGRGEKDTRNGKRFVVLVTLE